MKWFEYIFIGHVAIAASDSPASMRGKVSVLLIGVYMLIKGAVLMHRALTPSE